MHPRLHLTVIENETGRRVCSYLSRLDESLAITHRDFENEAWHRAVQDKRVVAHDRARYSIELR